MTLTKMTKAELIRALRAEQAKVVGLTQALSVARHESRAQRTQPSAPVTGRIGEVVSRYTRYDGTPMAKVRTGFNTFAHRVDA